MQHTLSTVLQDTSFFLPTTKYFFKFLYSEITGESAWWSCLGLLCVVSFSGNWRSSSLDSLRFRTSDIQDLPTSCRKFLYFMFFFVFSVLYTKNVLKRAQFSRYSTTFLTILQFSSEVSKNGGTSLPSYIQLQVYLTLYVQLCAPDDGWRKRLKHVEHLWK